MQKLESRKENLKKEGKTLAFPTQKLLIDMEIIEIIVGRKIFFFISGFWYTYLMLNMKKNGFFNILC